MAAFFLKNYARLGVENRLKAKKIYTMVAFVMLIALYIVIFRFSAEDGEQSSDVSTRVTEALLKGYYGLLGKSGEVTTELVLLLEGVVRKLAHFWNIWRWVFYPTVSSSPGAIFQKRALWQ